MNETLLPFSPVEMEKEIRIIDVLLVLEKRNAQQEKKDISTMFQIC